MGILNLRTRRPFRQCLVLTPRRIVYEEQNHHANEARADERLFSRCSLLTTSFPCRTLTYRSVSYGATAAAGCETVIVMALGSLLDCEANDVGTTVACIFLDSLLSIHVGHKYDVGRGSLLKTMRFLFQMARTRRMVSRTHTD